MENYVFTGTQGKTNLAKVGCQGAVIPVSLHTPPHIHFRRMLRRAHEIVIRTKLHPPCVTAAPWPWQGFTENLIENLPGRAAREHLENFACIVNFVHRIKICAKSACPVSTATAEYSAYWYCCACHLAQVYRFPEIPMEICEPVRM